MYRLIVGEGGCDARYFMREMTLREAQDFAEGLWARQHAAWEQTRLLANVIARSNGAKKDLDIRFPWEDEEVETKVATKEEVERGKRIMLEMEKRLNARLNNNGK